MKRHVLSSSIDADLFTELDRLAEREDESRSEIVNQLLREALHQRTRDQLVEEAAHAGTATATLGALYVTANLLLANLYALGLA